MYLNRTNLEREEMIFDNFALKIYLYMFVKCKPLPFEKKTKRSLFLKKINLWLRSQVRF